MYERSLMPKASKNAFLRNDESTISSIWNETTQMSALEVNSKALLMLAGLPLLANKGLATLVEKTEAGSKLTDDGFVDVFLHEGEASKAFIAGIQSVWDRPTKSVVTVSTNDELSIEELIDMLKNSATSVAKFTGAIKTLPEAIQSQVNAFVTSVMKSKKLGKVNAKKIIMDKINTLSVAEIVTYLGVAK